METKMADDDIDKGSDIDDVQYKPCILKTFKAGIDTVTSIAFIKDRNIGCYTIICNNKANDFTLWDKDGNIFLRRISTSISLPGCQGTSYDVHHISGSEFFRFYNYSGCSILIVCSEHNSYASTIFGTDLITVAPSGGVTGVNVNFCAPCGYKLDGNKYKFSSQLPTAYVTSVCQLGYSTNKIAVSCVDKCSYHLVSSSRRLVALYDPYGLLMGQELNLNIVIEYKKSQNRKADDKEERLFTYPKRIAESNTRDLWIVDRRSAHTGDVKVCDQGGMLKFIYNGPCLDSRFDPTDICSTRTDVLVITDCSNNRVHLVKNDVTFIQYLMTEQQGLVSPRSVCVNAYRHAWIGCNDGTVHIVKFILDFE